MSPTELSKLSQKRDFKGHLLPFNLKFPVDAWKSKSRSSSSREGRGVPGLWEALCFTQIYGVWVNSFH